MGSLSDKEVLNIFIQEAEKLVAEVDAPMKELERIGIKIDLFLEKAKVLKLTIKDSKQNKTIELCLTALFKLRQVSKDARN